MVEQYRYFLDCSMTSFREAEPDEDEVKCFDDEIDAVACHKVSG
jgi:hypothetical protein